MKPNSLNQPLTEAEIDRLGNFLKTRTAGRAMNLEEIDGFFSALISGPEIVAPSKYLPVLFGSGSPGTGSFDSLEEANEILGLLNRHWNVIAGTLLRDDLYLPVLSEDENGVAQGNDWARGFRRGMEMRHDSWLELLYDKEHGGCLVPVLALYHEHDIDPSLRPEVLDTEPREEIILQMMAGLLKAYRFFRGQRAHRPEPPISKAVQGRTKVGRNEPCPCGSGKKYKRCCGDATVH